MSRALAALGYLYANGKGVPRDARKSTDLIQKSAGKTMSIRVLDLAFHRSDSVIASVAEKRVVSANDVW